MTALAATTPQTRANSTAYSVGDLVLPAVANGYVYICKTAGTSGGSAPTFGTTLGGTTADGTVTWLCWTTFTTHHEWLLEQFRRFITGTGTFGIPAAGANTGGGTVINVSCLPATVTETWTLTCTAAAANSGTFSVVGSVSGAQTDATVGTPYANNYIGFTITDGPADYIVGDSFTIAVTRGAMSTAGTAWIQNRYDSRISTGIAWTRSSTTATITYPKHGLSVGSVFDLSASSDTAAITNGSKTVATVVDADRFTITCLNAGAASGTITANLLETHVYLKGLGAGGTDEIFVNLRSYRSVANDYYNIELRGAAGYLAGDYWASRADISPLADICLASTAIKYWFMANGRRFMIVAKASTIYESAYAGFLNNTGLPTEYPYPLVIGGSTAYTGKKYSANSGNDGYNHSAFWNPGKQTSGLGALYLMDKSGAWRNFANQATGLSVWSGGTNRVFPWGGSRSLSTTKGSPIYPNLYSGAIDNANSTRQLFGATLLSDVASPASKDIFGDLDGVYFVSGYANASENIVNFGGVDHLVVQNTYRTDADEYAAFKLA